MRTKTKQQLGKTDKCGIPLLARQQWKEVLRWFRRIARARSINGLFKRRQTLGPIQDRMSYLPEEIDNHSVKGQKLGPRGRPTEGSKKRVEFLHTMRHTLEDGGKPAHKWFQTTKCENLNHHYRLSSGRRITGAYKGPPGVKDSPIKWRQ